MKFNQNCFIKLVRTNVVGTKKLEQELYQLFFRTKYVIERVSRIKAFEQEL